jgi:hypothetical protein
MALPPYQISLKSTKRFKSCYWGTHRQTGDLINLFPNEKVPFNSITSLPNLMEIYQAVQKSMWGEGGGGYRQHGHPFLESTLRK